MLTKLKKTINRFRPDYTLKFTPENHVYTISDLSLLNLVGMVANTDITIDKLINHLADFNNNSSVHQLRQLIQQQNSLGLLFIKGKFANEMERSTYIFLIRVDAGTIEFYNLLSLCHDINQLFGDGTVWSSFAQTVTEQKHNFSARQLAIAFHSLSSFFTLSNVTFECIKGKVQYSFGEVLHYLSNNAGQMLNSSTGRNILQSSLVRAEDEAKLKNITPNDKCLVGNLITENFFTLIN